MGERQDEPDDAVSIIEVPDVRLGVPADASPEEDESPGFPKGDPSQA